MWGWEPTDSSREIFDFFKKHGITKILIPGFGYGRNAKIFIDNGFSVTGIEISETAIEIAKNKFGSNLIVHHGSVNSMPFDQESFDGIFSYALLHLLSHNERIKFINNCYHQLHPNGYMVFVSLSKMDSRYGQGNEISKDTFETKHGVTLFFYDSESIKFEFRNYGLINAEIFNEPKVEVANQPTQRFWLILCKKEDILK